MQEAGVDEAFDFSIAHQFVEMIVLVDKSPQESIGLEDEHAIFGQSVDEHDVFEYLLELIQLIAAEQETEREDGQLSIEWAFEFQHFRVANLFDEPFII